MRYLASKSGVTLKTGLGFVQGHKMAPFDRAHMSSYSPSIVTMAISEIPHPPWPLLISDVGLELEGTLINCSLL